MKKNRILDSLILTLGISTTYGAFDGDFSLTPPDPGRVFHLAPGAYLFGSWLANPTARGMFIDTTLAPTTLTLDTDVVFRGVGGEFLHEAPSQGIVSFSYTIGGVGEGNVGWLADDLEGPERFRETLSEVSGSGDASFEVLQGERFGFWIGAVGETSVPEDIPGQRIFTIENFSFSPVPEPSFGSLCAGGVILLSLSRLIRLPGRR